MNWQESCKGSVGRGPAFCSGDVVPPGSARNPFCAGRWGAGGEVAAATPSILPGPPFHLGGHLDLPALADTLAGSLPAAGPAFIMPQPFKTEVSITPVLPAGIRN